MDDVFVALNMIDRPVMLNAHYLLLMFSLIVSRRKFRINSKMKDLHTIKHFDVVVNTFAMNSIDLIG